MVSNIVVIGGSVGGIKALVTIVAALRRRIQASLFVVIHSSPESPRLIPEILSYGGKLPANYPKDGECFQPGAIYIASPNQHLLVEASGSVRLTFGPKENRFRPAIDPLFRSAALNFGPRAIGIILSGGLDDGVGGLAAIKAAGGIAIVQHPNDAEAPNLPRNALTHVKVDYCLPADEIGALLCSLIDQETAPHEHQNGKPSEPNKKLAIEVGLADQRKGFRTEILQLGSPSMLTCPECHGALMRLNHVTLLRYRCHTGHAFTSRSLLVALNERTEEALWNSVRALEETAMLLGHMVSHAENGEDDAAAAFQREAQTALRKARAVRSVMGHSSELIVEPAENVSEG